ncbi:hypothetical protein LIER_32639 [Lithospermum erythrorhizon]|uniref:Uncharacterized protein n=1 Tax=Lithospermum erythrorhizon TaxID=34254 RepID=A0AAV3S0A5_LITER
MVFLSSQRLGLEEGEETYTHTSRRGRRNELVTGQQSRYEVAIGDPVAPAPPQDVMAGLRRQVDAFSARVARQTRHDTNTELAGLATFSPDIRGEVMPAGLKLPTFTKFTGKIDPDEQIAEF